MTENVIPFPAKESGDGMPALLRARYEAVLNQRRRLVKGLGGMALRGARGDGPPELDGCEPTTEEALAALVLLEDAKTWIATRHLADDEGTGGVA